MEHCPPSWRQRRSENKSEWDTYFKAFLKSHTFRDSFASRIISVKPALPLEQHLTSSPPSPGLKTGSYLQQLWPSEQQELDLEENFRLLASQRCPQQGLVNVPRPQYQPSPQGGWIPHLLSNVL